MTDIIAEVKKLTCERDQIQEEYDACFRHLCEVAAERARALNRAERAEAEVDRLREELKTAKAYPVTTEVTERLSTNFHYVYEVLEELAHVIDPDFIGTWQDHVELVRDSISTIEDMYSCPFGDLEGQVKAWLEIYDWVASKDLLPKDHCFMTGKEMVLSALCSLYSRSTQEENIGPEWTCCTCGSVRNCRTITSETDYGTEYDLECNECGGTEFEESTKEALLRVLDKLDDIRSLEDDRFA